MRNQVPFKLTVALLAVCLLGTGFLALALRTFFGTTLNEPTTIEVQVEAPEEIPPNVPFAVSVRITSLITTSQTLHSIDLETAYLDNISLNGSSPAYRAVQKLPLTRFASYRYEELIPPQQTIVVELLFEGQKVGQFSGLIDVCLTDGTLCLAEPITTTVVE